MTDMAAKRSKAAARKSGKKRDDGGAIETLSELAGLVDRDVSQISRWCRDDRWPFHRSPPWPRSIVPKILRWIADTLLPGMDGPDAGGDGKTEDTKALRKKKLKTEIRKLLAQAEKCEIEIARERGRLLDVEDVKRTWANLGNAVRGGFQNLASSAVPIALRHGMPNAASVPFQVDLQQQIDEILGRLSATPAGELEDETEEE